VSVGVQLSERTLLTLFLIPVTVLAVAGIVANAIFPTLVADAPELVPALTTRADRLLLVVPLVPGELFLTVALIRELIGDLLADPLRDIASFITRYQWYLTPITFLLVAVSLWGQGRRGRGPVETVGELQEELARAEHELEGEATVRDAR
jgi:uncharacterized membrane protein